MSRTTRDPGDRDTVYLGNHMAVEVLPDPDDAAAANDEGRAAATLRRAVPGKQCTIIKLEPGLTLMQAAQIITHTSQGVWQAHSDADAPAWVASDWAALAGLLSLHWGGCEIREPDHAAHNGTAPGGEG